MDDLTNAITFFLLAIIALALFCVGIDWVSSQPVLIGTGIVKQMVYQPAVHSHGTATTLDQNSSTVITSSSTYEEYAAVVVIKKLTVSVSMPANEWGQMNEGDTVDVYEYRGRIFGFNFRKFLRRSGEK